jgi:lipopolysaccharide transport system permease protein
MNPHQQQSASPVEIAHSFWLNQNLIWQLAKRQVMGRYRGSVMGLAWSFFNPILMLGVYTFVFSVVFKTKWGIGVNESKTDFALLLFVGMIVYGVFSECVNNAPGLIMSNVNYVKKVVFPLEILPWITMASALFHAAISTLVWLAAYAFLNAKLQPTVMLLPLIILPLVFFTVGLTWFLASIGVFIRDISQIVGVLTMVLMFLSPVFYPVSAVPQQYRPLLQLNPLTYIIEESRNVLFGGRMPNWLNWGIYISASLIVMWAGFWWFQKTRKGFADVV